MHVQITEMDMLQELEEGAYDRIIAESLEEILDLHPLRPFWCCHRAAYVAMPKRGPTLILAADLMAVWSPAEIVPQDLPPPAPCSAVIPGTTPTSAITEASGRESVAPTPLGWHCWLCVWLVAPAQGYCYAPD